MAFDPSRIQSTVGFGVDYLSILVYGPAGAGKTSLAKTTGAPDKTLILAAEPGLLPLRGTSIKYVDIRSRDDLAGAIDWLEQLGRRGGLAGRWIVLDSISEIAERLLVELKSRPKSDPRAAYGEVSDVVLSAMKRCAALPCHTVFVAKQERLEDADQRLIYGPSLPGKKLAGSVAYEFDLVLPLRVAREGKDTVRRWLQTEADGKYEAKDRSGALDPIEPPDLAHLARKIAASMRSAPTTETAAADPANDSATQEQPA